jgi:hypothetical protein
MWYDDDANGGEDGTTDVPVTIMELESGCRSTETMYILIYRNTRFLWGQFNSISEDIILLYNFGRCTSHTQRSKRVQICVISDVSAGGTPLTRSILNN